VSVAGRPHIVWGVTGSVAAIRAPILAEELLTFADVKTVVTAAGRRFLGPLPPAIGVFDDNDEWSLWHELGDPVLHVELRKWADAFLIAPASADCLAKLAVGICDNLLLCVARAWDFGKPMLVAPAMNTRMWEHPTTTVQLTTLRSWGVKVIEPVEKLLACADVGMGAMAPPQAVADAVRKAIVEPNAKP
jgi:phosphopantothenoylcysteine decarboxylase